MISEAGTEKHRARRLVPAALAKIKTAAIHQHAFQISGRTAGLQNNQQTFPVAPVIPVCVFGVKFAHFSGKSSSAKIPVTGHAERTRRSQYIPADLELYVSASKVGSVSFPDGKYEIHGHTSTHGLVSRGLCYYIRHPGFLLKNSWYSYIIARVPSYPH